MHVTRMSATPADIARMVALMDQLMAEIGVGRTPRRSPRSFRRPRAWQRERPTRALRAFFLARAAALLRPSARIELADTLAGWLEHLTRRRHISIPRPAAPLDLLTPLMPNGPSVAPAPGTREVLAA